MSRSHEQLDADVASFAAQLEQAEADAAIEERLRRAKEEGDPDKLMKVKLKVREERQAQRKAAEESGERKPVMPVVAKTRKTR